MGQGRYPRLGCYHAKGFISIRETNDLGVQSTYKPESNPLGASWHGLAKVDWVAVWFFCLKVKSTTSPTDAF